MEDGPNMHAGYSHYVLSLVRSLAAPALALATVLTAAGAEEFADLRARFTPVDPTIFLQYRVAYRVFGIEIEEVAVANVGVTVGLWRSADGGRTSEVSLVEFNLDTLRNKETDTERDVHVSIHNRIVAVLRRPDMDAIVFAKRANQRFQFLWRKRVTNNEEIYNLETGCLRYHCADYLTGTQTTNLIGHAELTSEGKEVCRMLKLVHDAYAGGGADKDLTRDVPVYVYMRGDLVPYTIKVKDRDDPVKVFDRTMPALRLRAQPIKHLFALSYGSEVWVVSVRDLAARLGQQDLVRLSRDVTDWIMVPLIADLGFPLGTIRAEITEARVGPVPAATQAPAAGPKAK